MSQALSFILNVRNRSVWPRSINPIHIRLQCRIERYPGAAAFALKWIPCVLQIADQDSGLERLNELLMMPAICQAIFVNDDGSFELKFCNGSMLVVSVDADADEEATEFWRFFMPSTDAPHFVVGSTGILK